MESTNDKLQAEIEKKCLNTQEYTASCIKKLTLGDLRDTLTTMSEAYNMLTREYFKGSPEHLKDRAWKPFLRMVSEISWLERSILRQTRNRFLKKADSNPFKYY